MVQGGKRRRINGEVLAEVEVRVGIILVVMMLAQLGAAPPAQPASAQGELDAIRAAMASGDHAGAVAKIDQALFPPPRDPAQKFQLQMLKGECRLQLRDGMGASSAFKAAAKAAGNVEELAAATANALIIERSRSGKYAPRSGARGGFVGGAGSGEIDILSVESRKSAMLALRDDLQGQYQSQIDAARGADKLPPIERVFTHVADMYFLELYATGGAEKAGSLARELGGRAFELMRDEVQKSGSRIDELSQLANSSGTSARGWSTGRLGLTSQQRDEVRNMIPYLAKIRDQATEYRRVASRMGGDAGKWDALVADAVALIADAEALYNDR